mgnify:CR=1 FL=1
MVDVYQLAPGATRAELAADALYWGKYVAHDNNRDAMGVTLKLTAQRPRTPTSTGTRRCCTTCTNRCRISTTTPIGDGPYNALDRSDPDQTSGR